ncbi:hypothetical protein ANCDUO_22775 [Ancylostoma duodenale]|uniref:Uncharacterized protein n=1 Tax=Ancylostoma duodenale TaxID=51022 RepID=A0A0C2FK92_9BILA|nr:hypothetical protein ANCDUO_22775 [Ancylostoma duodenale]
MNATNQTAVQDQVTLGETIFYLSNGAVGSLFNCIVLWIALVYIDTDDKPRQGGCDRVQIDPYIYMPICILYVVVIVASFTISAIIYFIAHASTRSETRQRTVTLSQLLFQ